MTDDSCQCCGTVTDSDGTNGSSATQWQVDGSVLTTELPDELSLALGQFLGVEAIETLGGWVAAVRHHVDGSAITISDLCMTSAETEHWGVVDGETYYFACFYDGVILAAVVESPVEIRTQSPDGTVIEARAIGSEKLAVTPDDAVFSFGIDHEVSPPPDDGPSLEAGYAAICPYVRAFPARDAYEQWATSVQAATVAMPLAGATTIAAALVE